MKDSIITVHAGTNNPSELNMRRAQVLDRYSFLIMKSAIIPDTLIVIALAMYGIDEIRPFYVSNIQLTDFEVNKVTHITIF